MTALRSNSIPQVDKEESPATEASGGTTRYRQLHRLVDMSVGRIRRWGQPFRRAFLM